MLILLAMDATRSKSFLPAGLAPRGLSRVEAASYVGVSPCTFDRMIKDGLMPKPLRVYGRTIWDRHAIDDAFGALSDAAAGEDRWDQVAA